MYKFQCQHRLHFLVLSSPTPTACSDFWLDICRTQDQLLGQLSIFPLPFGVTTDVFLWLTFIDVFCWISQRALWAEAGVTAAGNWTVPDPALHAASDAAEHGDGLWHTVTGVVFTGAQSTSEAVRTDEAQPNAAWAVVSSHWAHRWGRL